MAVNFTVSDIFDRVKRQFGDESGVQFSEGDLIRWINDGQREAVMQNEGLLMKIDYLDSVADQKEYTLPEDCFTLHHVDVKDGSSAVYYSVKWLGLKQFSEFLDGWDGATINAYPQVYTNQQEDKLLLFPAPGTDVISGIKLTYSRYPTDVVDSTSAIDLPAYFHPYLVNFCLMQAYELDEDWESVAQKAQQVQGDLDFNNNRQFWFGRDSYPTVSTNYEDREVY